MRLLLFALFASTVAIASVVGSFAEYNPVRQHPLAQPQPGIHRVMVKLRAAISTASATTAAVNELSPHDRVVNLAARRGLLLEESHAITDRLHALQVQPAAQGESIDATLARLRADPEVEYADADQRRYIHAAGTPPNDPLYASNQWYLQNSTTTPAAIDVITAWGTTLGSSSLVIADLDTGVRYDHPDFQAGASGVRLLPGYCFIHDSVVNNGGTCLGPTVSQAEASDPGDWVTSSDLNTTECSGGQTSNSSWHGTRTAGLLGATTNNSVGIAAVSWQGQVLPVRVLGKCGGYDSDIAQGMLWAAGIAVAGVPANRTPAKIINMSLGGSGSCPSTYSDVISQITAMGVLVVVSAGNANGPVDAPGNCPGVAAVAGLRQVGTKVGYSSFGPQVALSAPAGNCVNTNITSSTPCLYPITSTTNPGTTTPSATYTTSNAYTDEVTNPNLGTSFSAPLVAGIGALMASVNSNLSSCQLIARLQEGSVPFPQTSPGETPQPPVCSASNPSTTAECICPRDGSQCGVGMASASGAVAAALRPIAAMALPATVSAGQPVSLNAQGSAGANGHTISSYQWTSVGTQTLSIQSATAATATVTAPSCGLGTVQLVVTDDAGRTDTADVVLSTTAATSIAPTAATVKGCMAAAPSILLAVCPATMKVEDNGGTLPLTATVANSTDESVTWQVNGVTGGSTTVGTISSTGVYAAPATVPMPATVSVTAVSAADSTVSASAQITVFTNVTVAVAPSSMTVHTNATQAMTATVANTSNAAVTWQVNGVTGGNSTVGTISTAGVYTAPATVPSPATVTILAISTAEPTVSGTASVTVALPPKSGGGSMDPITLCLEALALGAALISRRYARRWAASSQLRCARR